MITCPEESTPQTCGLEAVRFLVEGNRIVLEPFNEDTPIIMDLAARSVMEVLNPLSVDGNAIHSVANFGCAACGKCVQIVNDGGDMLFKQKGS
jgi:Na+-transporting NADH:ubiquinone oxidoreductase subunit NqrF